MTFPVSRQPIIAESEWKLSSIECRSWALNHVTFPSSVTLLLLYLIRYAFIDFSLISALPNCEFLKNECHFWTPQCLIQGLSFSAWLLCCVWLCDPTDCLAYQAPLSMGILQARILEWVVLAPRGSFWPQDWIWVSCIAGRFFTNWATREATFLVPVTYSLGS